MKFIADSCSNLSLPAVEGDVSINTATNTGKDCPRSSEKVSICCGTLSSRITKSFLVRPGTNCPFLSTTVIGSRTRRMNIVSDCSSPATGGVGLGFGACCCACTTAGTTKQASNNNRVKRLGKLSFMDLTDDFYSVLSVGDCALMPRRLGSVALRRLSEHSLLLVDYKTIHL